LPTFWRRLFRRHYRLSLWAEAGCWFWERFDITVSIGANSDAKSPGRFPAPEGVNVGDLDSRGWLILLLAPLSVLVIIGVTMPAPLGTLLNRIREIVSQ